MFYKVIYKNRVIGVLDDLVYLKYQNKYGRMVFCDESEAQAIFSSDRSHIWHEESLYNIPVSGYDTVRVEEIDEYEYNQLKILNCNTVNDVIDEFVMFIIDNDKSLFVESLKRLYVSQKIDESKVIELCNNGEITVGQKGYVLSK